MSRKISLGFAIQSLRAWLRVWKFKILSNYWTKPSNPKRKSWLVCCEGGSIGIPLGIPGMTWDWVLHQDTKPRGKPGAMRMARHSRWRCVTWERLLNSSVVRLNDSRRRSWRTHLTCWRETPWYLGMKSPWRPGGKGRLYAGIVLVFTIYDLPIWQGRLK